MRKYEIKEKDTLESIAKENNMEIDELIEINEIKDRTKLGIGNILRVKVAKNGKDKD
jgi:LysM repeat protein